MATQLAPIAVGDVIEVDGRRVGDTPRKGEVLDVLGAPEHAHYRVRWDDEHETLFYPAGNTRIRTTTRAGTPLVETLRAADVEFELLPHPRTLTARGEARALGVLPQETAKTVVARTPEAFVRAVVPASARLDLTKLAAVLGETQLELADEHDLAGAYPQFELGAVPPFGGPSGDVVVIDRSLAEREYVVLEAGVHDRSLRLRGADLVAVARALVADIAARG